MKTLTNFFDDLLTEELATQILMDVFRDSKTGKLSDTMQILNMRINEYEARHGRKVKLFSNMGVETKEDLLIIGKFLSDYESAMGFDCGFETIYISNSTTLLDTFKNSLSSLGYTLTDDCLKYSSYPFPIQKINYEIERYLASNTKEDQPCRRMLLSLRNRQSNTYKRTFTTPLLMYANQVLKNKFFNTFYIID